MTEPAWMKDELGQHHCYSHWMHHYVVGISHDKDEARKRWEEALREAMR